MSKSEVKFGYWLLGDCKLVLLGQDEKAPGLSCFLPSNAAITNTQYHT